MSGVLLVDFLIGRSVGGHTAEYLGLLQDALAGRPFEVLAPYLEETPPAGRVDRYHRFIRAMWSAFRRGDVVVFHTPEARDILVLWTLTTLPVARRGCAVIMMRRGAEIMFGRDDWRARLIERCVRGLVARRVVHLVSDSHAAARTWSAITGRDVPVIPLPVRPGLEAARANHREGPLTVSLLGLFREEKGIDHYETVLRIAREIDPEVRLFCQVADTPLTTTERAVTEALAGHYAADPRATIHAGHLSAGDYDRALLASDVVVLPYDPALYTSGTSGLLFDALTAGAVVLSTRIAWGVEEFRDSASIVWLDGRGDDDLRRGLTEAFSRARRRRRDGIPSDLPSAEAFATGWSRAISQAVERTTEARQDPGAP
ncbi:MAG: hypothetical protein CVU47_01780 [Chloroflexi bacterium HGW-Chloroflexi-9]|nr:MAG: hypothetical protein CVU47_01780 [Chloroflexi bacterium HGW-Chloroflexi-9]